MEEWQKEFGPIDREDKEKKDVAEGTADLWLSPSYACQPYVCTKTLPNEIQCRVNTYTAHMCVFLTQELLKH